MELVLGAAGGLGRTIVEQLAAAGRRVRAFDRVALPHHLGVEALIGDICDYDALRSAFKGVETIYLVAAVVDWRPGWRPEVERVNVAGPRTVIAAAKAAGVHNIVYTSSVDVVFGGAPIRHGDERLPYPKRHLDHYGAAKAAGERLILAADGPDLRTCSLRVSGLWGRYDRVRIGSFLPVVRSGWVPIFGNGQGRFSHLYLENAAAAHLQAAAALKHIHGRAFFLTDEEPRNFYDKSLEILSVLNLRYRKIVIPDAIAHPAAHLSEMLYLLYGQRRNWPASLTRYTIAATAYDFHFTGEAARQTFFQPVVDQATALARTHAWVANEYAA